MLDLDPIKVRLEEWKRKKMEANLASLSYGSNSEECFILHHGRRFQVMAMFDALFKGKIEDDVAALLAEVEQLRGYNEDLNLELAACDQKLRAFRKELKPGREPHA